MIQPNVLTRSQERISRFDTLFTRRDGKVLGVNKRRLYENPFFLQTNPPDNNITVLAGVSSGAYGMRVSGEGPMQLVMLGAVQDADHGNVLVRLFMRDGTTTDLMMNNPCHIDTIFGPGGEMYPLPEALYVDENRALSAVFTDLTAGGTQVRVVAVGAKYQKLREDPGLQRVRERLQNSQFISTPYFYTCDDGAISITGNSNTTAEITIDAKHNFEIHQLSVVSTGTFDLNIVDVTKGESIIDAPKSSNYAVPSSMLLGNGSYPFRFHEPILVFGGQKLQVTMYDTSGSTNVVYLTLGGRAIKVRQWT